MAKLKTGTPKHQEIALTELPSGQLTFIPEMPYEVAKARGPVIDEVIRQSILEHTAILVDDTVETIDTSLPIHTKVMLDYDQIDIETQGLLRLTAFDREVIDAVMSLIPYNDSITADMIYRVMIGKRTSRYISDHQRKMVRQSLMRCSHAWLHISLTDMYEKDSPIGRILKDRGIRGTYSEQILSFKVLATEAKGKCVERYVITSNPVLFSYAASLGKITMFPIELIDTDISKTEKVIVLQSFLLRSIDEMYRDASIPRFIEINDIYASIGATNDTRPHKLRIREDVETILSNWISKNLIVSYTVRSGGRVIKGYELVLHTTPPYSLQSALPSRR